MSSADVKLPLVGLLLTAHVYNREEKLDESDLPVEIRKHFWDVESKQVKRPITVRERDVEALCGVDVKNFGGLPFLVYDRESGEFRFTVPEMGVKWFLKQKGALEIIRGNPVLAYFFEGYDSLDVSYQDARARVRPREADREWIDSLVQEVAREKGGEDMLRLVRISAPEDVKERFSDLVLTPGQRAKVEKIAKAIQYRDYLRGIGLHDIGKLLFVGPPGTGKTSTARALSEKLGLPVLEVRLSQIADQYLGETAKNIDRVFELAKRLSPCLLFIDEFDFVAKTRTTDEHAALKRAVNTLLKAIDDISLVEDGVLLIGATNQPSILDQAAWRRFDEIVYFDLPDREMRREILDLITSRIEGEIDTEKIAAETDGCSGSDLRLIVREAVLEALLEGRKRLTQGDLEKAVQSFRERRELKNNEF